MARILLVDDEPQLLSLLQRYLTRMGYEVQACNHPLDALSCFEANASGYDLVIADVGMPDMSGDTLLLRIIDLNPRVRILVCSGSPFAISSLPPHVRPQAGTLLKPFSPQMLLQSIQELFARKVPG